LTKSGTPEHSGIAISRTMRPSRPQQVPVTPRATRAVGSLKSGFEQRASTSCANSRPCVGRSTMGWNTTDKSFGSTPVASDAALCRGRSTSTKA